MSDPTPMNEKAQEALRMLEIDQPGITNDLIGTFVIDAPKQLRRIEAAYSSGNVEALKQFAHYLRSGALVLGLTDLCELSRQVEFLETDEYGTSDADQLVARLHDEVQPLIQALSEQLMRG